MLFIPQWLYMRYCKKDIFNAQHFIRLNNQHKAHRFLKVCKVRCGVLLWNEFVWKKKFLISTGKKNFSNKKFLVLAWKVNTLHPRCFLNTALLFFVLISQSLFTKHFYPCFIFFSILNQPSFFLFSETSILFATILLLFLRKILISRRSFFLNLSLCPVCCTWYATYIYVKLI